MSRTVAELQARVAARSTAPRYLSITDFAIAVGESSQQLTKWLRSGRIWVPRPAVLLGETERPGWESRFAESWRRGLPGVDQPEPVRYLNTAEMLARWHVSRLQLWEAIADEVCIPQPAIWITRGHDVTPGWEAAHETSDRPVGK